MPSGETDTGEPTGPALQDRYAPHTACFGCGPANAQGLRIKSHPVGDRLIARFHAQPHHQAFPGVVNGGIIGALLDCHANWAATWAIMQRLGLDQPLATVTAEYHVKFRRPTPLDAELTLAAWPTEVGDDRAVVEATLSAGGQVTATCRGVFVAVKPGHPAYHRW
jgi:acyl-coenzyme A thioesterase PaaI-like protein